MNRSFSHIALVLSVFALLPALHIMAGGRDVSNRCSLTGALKICSWSCGGFEPVFPAGEEGWKWRTYTHAFDEPVDLSGHTVINYDILVPQGPGRDFDTRLTLRSSADSVFTATAHIIPTLWQGVTFDVHACPFLDDISALEIAVRNQTDQPWEQARFSIDRVLAGKPLDLDFEVSGSADRFIPSGDAAIRQHGGAAMIDFKQGGVAEISTIGSRNSIYNPELEKRNTVALNITNNSTADSLKLTVTTDREATISKTVSLPPKGVMTQININLSDISQARGHVEKLRFEPLGGEGSLLIDRLSFEYEAPIEVSAGEITDCTATPATVSISGRLGTGYLVDGSTIEIRHCPFWQSELPFDSLELLGSVAASPAFTVSDIPNSRLGGKMSHLSSRFVAGLRLADGSVVPVGKPFYISNWREFIDNPYQFDTAETDYLVRDYGAVGDGISNDNAAIQRAIDATARAGGGRVFLDGKRTYLATNLELRRGVNLVIDSGSVLRQSPIFEHYTEYPPEYGHDNVIPGIPWTHCMYTNRPLILAKDTDHVKITGGGTIRMDDTYSENPLWTHYARTCSDRIHIVPIAICNTKHVEISDIDIVRCNNYHTIFYRADSVFIGNVKLYEVACLSGDGFSFGNAVTNVRVGRCVFESNDDGIVLCSSYKDPRGGVWRQRVDSIDSSVRHIEVIGSYIDSNRGGAGKAIALIPWGSTNPRQDYNEIDNIEVRDCVLRGGHSVGSWPDNPFDGKPFDNTEPDDYAPVKNLRILGNEYLSACDLFGVVPTTLLTDCGLTGSAVFKNNDFSDRTAYWTIEGKSEAAAPGEITLEDARIYQGLYLEPGRYTLTMNGKGKLKPCVTDMYHKPIKVDRHGSFMVKEPSTCLVGAKGRNATLNSLTITKQ